MQADLEQAIEDLGEALVILPDLKRKRRKRQLSGIGGFKAPWAGGGAILVEEDTGTNTQRRDSSPTDSRESESPSSAQGNAGSSQRRSSQTVGSIGTDQGPDVQTRQFLTTLTT